MRTDVRGGISKNRRRSDNMADLPQLQLGSVVYEGSQTNWSLLLTWKALGTVSEPYGVYMQLFNDAKLTSRSRLRSGLSA